MERSVVDLKFCVGCEGEGSIYLEVPPGSAMGKRFQNRLRGWGGVKNIFSSIFPRVKLRQLQWSLTLLDMEHRFEMPAGDFQEVTAEDLANLETRGTNNGIILPAGSKIEVGQLVKKSFEAKEKDKDGIEKTVIKDAFYFICRITVDGKSTIVPVSYRTFNPFPKERKRFLLQSKFGTEVHNAFNDRARADFISGKNLVVKELQDCEYKPHGSSEYRRKPFMVLEME